MPSITLKLAGVDKAKARFETEETTTVSRSMPYGPAKEVEVPNAACTIQRSVWEAASRPTSVSLEV